MPTITFAQVHMTGTFLGMPPWTALIILSAAWLIAGVTIGLHWSHHA